MCANKHMCQLAAKKVPRRCRFAVADAATSDAFAARL